MVRAVGRKIFALEFAEAALGESDQLRRAGQLEVDVRKLFGVLSLPGSASGARRNYRRTTPQRTI